MEAPLWRAHCESFGRSCRSVQCCASSMTSSRVSSGSDSGSQGMPPVTAGLVLMLSRDSRRRRLASVSRSAAASSGPTGGRAGDTATRAVCATKRVHTAKSGSRSEWMVTGTSCWNNQCNANWVDRMLLPEPGWPVTTQSSPGARPAVTWLSSGRNVLRPPPRAGGFSCRPSGAGASNMTETLDGGTDKVVEVPRYPPRTAVSYSLASLGFNSPETRTRTGPSR